MDQFAPQAPKELKISKVPPPVKPRNDRVLLRYVPEEVDSEIILLDATRNAMEKKSSYWEIVAMGPGNQKPDGTRVVLDPDLQPGRIVFLQSTPMASLTQFEMMGYPGYCLVQERVIEGVVIEAEEELPR